MLMENYSETRKLLEEISDTGCFELLATDVLRMSDNRYRSLSHPGVNKDGKPIPSPTDGISITYTDSEKTLILVAHTTTERTKLRGKWLTDTDSDIAKIFKIIDEEKERASFYKAVVILTTNREPVEELMRDVHALGKEGLEFDIWTSSRIAFFLDNDPEGQWIRYKVFGKEVQRVSASLLEKLSRKSLEIFRPQFESGTTINREVDENLWEMVQSNAGTSFVTGESGHGKTVACWRLGQRWIEHGKYVFVLSHQMIDQYPSLSQALAAEICRLEPSLEMSCGASVLAFCRQEESLLLVVEDVNEAGKPDKLIEYILNWQNSDSDQERKQPPSWRLLCPIWPSTVAQMDPRVRDLIDRTSLEVGPFSRDESIEAIRLGKKRFGSELTDIQINDIAIALGDDPLLIALNSDISPVTISDVIGTFIAHNVKKAQNEDVLEADLSSALTRLFDKMVVEGNITPSWSAIDEWLKNDQSVLLPIRRILNQGKIIRLVQKGDEYLIAYRHDRVRDFLVIQALARLVQGKQLPDHIWSDPYFSVFLGSIAGNFADEDINKLARLNPVSLLVALKVSDLELDKRNEFLQKVEDWINSSEFSEPSQLSRRYHAIEILSQTDGDFVCKIVRKFNDAHWGKLEARLRNGDAEAGVTLCYSVDPGLWHIWRDKLIEHAVYRHPKIIDDLADYIKSESINEKALTGALNFAGELGEKSFTDLLYNKWLMDPSVDRISSAWIWAALMCFDGRNTKLLDSLCEVWASLPEEQKTGAGKLDKAPRWDLVGHTLPSALARRAHEQAVDYLIEKAVSCPELDRPISTMIKKVDLPQAVIFTARKMAKIDHEIEGTDGINLFASFASQPWNKDDHGRRMSDISRLALRQQWDDPKQDKWIRLRSFGLWTQTLADLDNKELAKLKDDKDLADPALKLRLLKGDNTAILELRKRLRAEEKYHSYWWHQVRKVGLEELKDLVEEVLTARRNGRLKNFEHGERETDYILSELLMDGSNEFSEKMLIEHWDHLKESPTYVLAALFIATPELINRVRDVVTASSNPEEFFRHLNMRWGYRTVGRPGITRFEQLKAVAPFIEYLDYMCVDTLYSTCNRMGLYSWRKKHIDPFYFQFEKSEKVGNKEGLFNSLDRLVTEPGEISFHIEYWLKNRQEEGHTPSSLLDLISDWATEKQSLESLKVLAVSIRLIGNRMDLARLENEGIYSGENAKAEVSNCSYAVKRNSLN